jgi:transcription initiation factor TFIID TATA-box-binding protein
MSHLFQLKNNNKVYQCRLSLNGSVHFELPLICELLSGKLDGVRFPACVVKVRDPKCTVMIFRTGKVVITGASSQIEAALASNLIVDQLRKVERWNNVDVYNLKLVNIVANAVLGVLINMDLLNEDMLKSKSCIFNWEPELFGGAYWKTGDMSKLTGN